jgi:hypothetical protein
MLFFLPGGLGLTSPCLALLTLPVTHFVLLISMLNLIHENLCLSNLFPSFSPDATNKQQLTLVTIASDAWIVRSCPS